MTFKQRGISLIEVLIATTLLSTLSVYTVKSQIYLLREMGMAKQHAQIIRELNNRMELLRQDTITGGDLYSQYQQEIVGVEFVNSIHTTSSSIGIKGTHISIEGGWINPHGHAQVVKLSSWVAFH